MNKRPPLPYSILQTELLKKNVTEVSYEELLWTEEWLYFRESIKERDNFTCKICDVSQIIDLTDIEYEKAISESGYGKYFDLLEGVFVDSPTKFSTKKYERLPSRQRRDKNIKLEVHHLYYIWKKFPWEYNKSALITLCDNCHELQHQQITKIYVDDKLDEIKELVICQRCGGLGYIPEYKHVQNGICFNCGGLGGLDNGTSSNKFDITKKKLF